MLLKQAAVALIIIFFCPSMSWNFLLRLRQGHVDHAGAGFVAVSDLRQQQVAPTRLYCSIDAMAPRWYPANWYRGR